MEDGFNHEKKEVDGTIDFTNFVKTTKEGFNKTAHFFKQKKVINIIVVILLLFLLIFGSWIRIQGLENLKDSTTGEYIPLALDPFYFLRVAETMVGGGLPSIDSMRYIPLELPFTSEFLPTAVVTLYKIANIFSDNVSLRFIDVVSPVIFFIIALVVFFFLTYALTKSKWAALISSFFLAIMPSYLYRTMAGFSDHESIGMLGFFLAFLLFSISLKFLDKGVGKKYLTKTIFLGLVTGLFSGFAMVSWGGSAMFLFMIFPLSFLIFWLLKSQTLEKKNSMKYFIIYYFSWMISSIFFGILLGFSLQSLLGRFILSTSGLISLFMLGFIVIDFLLIKNIPKTNLFKKYPREVYSLIGVFLAGIIFLILSGQNPLSLLGGIWNSLIHPFGTGRVGLTVAENSQPFLNDWINQTGKILFWIFILGITLIGFDISKKIRPLKEKIIFILSWIFMFSGILFSRISASSSFNGTNFISQAFYLVGLILFVYYSVKLYFKNKLRLGPEIIIISSWMFFMLISSRSAIRFFFVLTPFIAFIIGYSFVKIIEYLKKNKEEITKLFIILILILIIFGLIISANSSIKNSVQQAKFTGPSANYQWQQAMSWIRTNTSPGSIFVHWWDYGYWVQTLGERPTVTDGGHGNGFWDHLIGRYVLTTPFPETALSFMKAHKASYLLIDPTDLGKYPAYSRIGGNDDHDRFSSIQIVSADPSQTRETSTGTLRVYPSGGAVDEDIFYTQGDSEIFLPGPVYDEIGKPQFKTGVAAIILEINAEGIISQPIGIFIYNGQQVEIPLRYIYNKGEILDFGIGVESTFYILPKITPSNVGLEIDELGSGIYISPKVSKSLFAQLYLMDDSFNKYEGISLAHTESSPIVSSLKSQGLYLGEFIYYQGFQGPIKIWKINPSENIIARDEFLKIAGDYAEFDNLQFIK